MAGDPGDDLRFMTTPRGFVVLREDELDPEYGRPDRWMYRGIINGRSVIRDGIRSHAAACRAAWMIVDDLLATGTPIEIGDVIDADQAVAEVLARRYHVKRERLSEETETTMSDRYTVERDTWAAMKADLLAQMLRDAGSVRKLAREIGVPRSTLGSWVTAAKRDGSWPK